MEDIRGAGVVITGGASGIGLATAAELVRRGARLVLADVDQQALDTVVAHFRNKGAEATGVACDVTSLAQVEQLAERAFEALGHVDIVFNNAGVALAGPVQDVSHDDWRWIIDVDLWGPIHGVEAFLPRMIAQGLGGHLLFTASFAGLVPNIGLGPYCVAKYGVVALAEVLHRELRPHGIGVSVLCPMMVATNIGASGLHRGEAYGGPPSAPVAPALPSEAQPEGGAPAANLAGRVLPVEDVARLTVDAIQANRLYVLPHEESREPIRRRFDRIDRTFEDEGS